MPRIRAPISFRDLWPRLPGWAVSCAVSASRLAWWEGTQAVTQPHSPGTDVYDGAAKTQVHDSWSRSPCTSPLRSVSPSSSKFPKQRGKAQYSAPAPMYLLYLMSGMHTGSSHRPPRQWKHGVCREAGRVLLKAQRIGSGE